MELLEIILIALACPLALPLVTEEGEETCSRCTIENCKRKEVAI